MALTTSKVDDLESWLEGLGSLREKLLEQGLKTKEELLWLSQEEIDSMCSSNDIPLFEKKRLEMKLLALQALNKTVDRSPSPNGNNTSKKKNKKNKHLRNDSNYSISTTKGGGHGHRDDIYTDDGSGYRNRQPTIVRIVFSEAEEAKLNELDEKLTGIKDKIDQIMQNMSSLNWEKDRLEKRIDFHFNEFVMDLQQRRVDLKTNLNDITSKQMNTMKKYIQSLNKQTKEIKEAQKKCEKYLSNTKLNKNQRRNKVLKVANKALDNKKDLKIIIPAIDHNKLKHNSKKHGHGHGHNYKNKKEPKNYFVNMELEQNQIKRYIEGIGEIRRVLVPYPPKFEIFTIEATRIKLKVWDQTNSNNKMAKKEKTEFLARIAEQLPRTSTMYISDDDSSNKIIEEGVDKLKGGGHVHSSEKKEDNSPDIIINEDEKKDEISNDLSVENDDENEEEENASVNIMLNDNENEEHKYNQNQQLKSRESKKFHKKRTHSHNSHSKRHSKKKKIDWDQYPVFKPRDGHDRKVISNKYTIWIENLKPNTTYLLKLRGYNKYGNGDWTKVYSFVTKLTSFEFKSSIIKSPHIKNNIFEILCKKLIFNQNNGSQSNGNNNNKQFALKRIFSTESMGFTSAKFHEICDNKEKILIIIESEYGSIFGGYTELGFSIPSNKNDNNQNEKNDKWKNDLNSFLFLLRNSKKQDVNLIFDCIDQYNATRSNINSGPCFGQGFDLYICDNCHKLNNSYSTTKSYNIPANVKIGGRQKFKVKNYDVYIVV